MAQRLDKSKNIMRTLNAATEVDLITGEDVQNRLYGHSNNSLTLDNIYICNTSTVSVCKISLYLKSLLPTQNPKIAIEKSYDPKIHIFEPGVSDETYSYHYFCKELVVPVGSSVQFEKDIFKGIDFLYHSLRIVADSDSRGSVTLNINH